MSSSIKILKPSGVLDGILAGPIRQEIIDEMADGPKTVLLDLREVTFIDSSGLGALVAARKQVLAKGGRLCVCSVNDQVKMLFELTSMDRVFEIFKDQQAFQQALVSQTSS